MNARVTFLEPKKDPAEKKSEETKLYVVPKRALVDHGAGKGVLVVVDGKVQPKAVVVQKEVGPDVFISSGLAGTEAIIVSEQLSQLKAGDRVEVK